MRYGQCFLELLVKKAPLSEQLASIFDELVEEDPITIPIIPQFRELLVEYILSVFSGADIEILQTYEEQIKRDLSLPTKLKRIGFGKYDKFGYLGEILVIPNMFKDLLSELWKNLTGEKLSTEKEYEYDELLAIVAMVITLYYVFSRFGLTELKMDINKLIEYVLEKLTTNRIDELGETVVNLSDEYTILVDYLLASHKAYYESLGNANIVEASDFKLPESNGESVVIYVPKTKAIILEHLLA